MKSPHHGAVDYSGAQSTAHIPVPALPLTKKHMCDSSVWLPSEHLSLGFFHLTRAIRPCTKDDRYLAGERRRLAITRRPPLSSLGFGVSPTYGEGRLGFLPAAAGMRWLSFCRSQPAVSCRCRQQAAAMPTAAASCWDPGMQQLCSRAKTSSCRRRCRSQLAVNWRCRC